jgi:DNA polymerase-3 subunit alpha
MNSRDEETPTAELIAESVQSLKDVRDKRVKRLELRVRADLVNEDRLNQLRELAKKYAGGTPVAVLLVFPGQAEALIGARELKVSVSDELIFAVDKLFGEKVVELA